MSDASLSAPRTETWVREALEYRLSQVHVCLPGKILAYDVNTQRADVQPLIKYRFMLPSGAALDEAYPVLPSVPVVDQRAGSAFLHMPVGEGDYVMLVFCEASMDAWLSSLGTPISPGVSRRHDLSDAIAMPVNLYPDAQALVGVNADNISLGFIGGSSMHVKPSGKVTLGSDSELFSVAVGEKVNTNQTTTKAILTALVADVAAIVSVLTPAFPALAAAASSGGVALTAANIAGYPVTTASTKVKTDV